MDYNQELHAVPAVVITGGVTSAIHVTVRDVVDVLPQPSVAVNVLVCERLQPSVANSSIIRNDTVTAPQASVAVAVPRAPFISPADGLQPRFTSVQLAVITGGVTSAIHVTVRDVVDVLPQASIAVNVLVCERLHPLN